MAGLLPLLRWLLPLFFALLSLPSHVYGNEPTSVRSTTRGTSLAGGCSPTASRAFWTRL